MSSFQCVPSPLMAAVLALLVHSGCEAGPKGHEGIAGTPGTQATELRVVQHEEPRRDFVGPRPATFRWSAIAGADRYAIGLWNDADRLLWRQDDLTNTSVAWPAGLDVEAGTYFWSVSALQQGREIAKSGLAAFVVE